LDLQHVSTWYWVEISALQQLRQLSGHPWRTV